MKKSLLILLFLSLASLFTSVSIANAQTKTINTSTVISQDTTWDGTVIIDGARITVAQNVTLTLKPGTIVSGKNGALIYVVGKLNALGEEDKRIRFTAEENEKPSFSLTYYLDSTTSSEVNLKYFILEKGGGNQDTASLPALTIRGKASFTKGIVRRNLIAAVRVWSNDVKIEDCEIYENENIALENKSASNTLKVEDNWWGSEDGPTTTTLPNNPRALVKGAVDFDPWQKKGPIPIVILPGFGGSFSFKLLTDKAKNDWWLPPLGTSAYRYFAKALILSNYYHDKDFFWGFYDWRMPCEESAKKYLEEVIDKAKEKSGHSQVHIVAHSMGGLVARSYIEDNDFRDDVDSLVTAGTPHLGSSEAYPIWEGGELLDDRKPIYVYLWYLEALNRDWNKVSFIRKNFPSVGEMMPIYDYLENSSNGQPIAYKNQKLHNKFLESLSDNSNLENLKRKATTQLIVGDKENTLEKIKVASYEGDSDKWEDGIPDPFNPPEDTDKGDGTVTAKSASADNKITKNIITVDSSHSQLLQTGTKPIFEQLKVRAKFPFLFKLMSRFLLTTKGPVDIEIDDLGKILSKSKQQIEDGRYQEQEVDQHNLTYADFPYELNDGDRKSIKITFTGKNKDNLKAGIWNFSAQNDYQKQEIEVPVSNGSKLIYSVKLEKDKIAIKPIVSLKNLMVIVNRLYEEGKITNWKIRSRLINSIAEAYQNNSNGRTDEAKDKISQLRYALDSYDSIDSKSKKIIADSCEYQENNPE